MTRAGTILPFPSDRANGRQFIERTDVALAATPRIDIGYARETYSDGEAQHYG